MPAKIDNVLFLCAGSSARPVFAEGLLVRAPSPAGAGRAGSSPNPPAASLDAVATRREITDIGTS